MNGIIKKIKELNLRVDSVEFNINPGVTATNYGATLSLENSSDYLQAGSLVKKINISTRFNGNIADVDEDVCIDKLFALAGFDCNGKDSPFSLQEEAVRVDKKEEETKVIPPLPPVMPVSSGGFSIPSMPTMPSASSSNGYSKPSPPKAPKIDMDVPPQLEKKAGGIRDVQMLAIQALIKIKKTSYEELIKEAFEENNIVVDSLPAIENLTENQALEVIKFGNNKYKKQ